MARKRRRMKKVFVVLILIVAISLVGIGAFLYFDVWEAHSKTVVTLLAKLEWFYLINEKMKRMECYTILWIEKSDS